MRKWIGYGGVALATLLWGASYQIGHDLSVHLSPWTLTTWRFTWAALLATFAARLVAGDGARVPRAVLPRVLAMGTLGHGAFSLFFFYGLQATPPAIAAVVSGLEPLAIMVMGSVYFRQRLAGAIWASAGVSVLGAVLAAYQTGSDGAAGSWYGPMLMLLSTVCFGVYTLLGKEVLRHMSPLAMTAATMRWSLPVLWIATLLHDGPGMFLMPSPADLVRLAYFVLGVSILAFLGWNLGIERLGLNRTAIWGNGIPVVGAILAAVSGLPLQPHQWLGLALVVWGVHRVQALDPGETVQPAAA